MEKKEVSKTRLDDIDADELSSEEYMYYIEVMARIEAKLLEAAE